MALRFIDLIPDDDTESWRKEPSHDGTETILKVETIAGARVLDSPFDPWGESQTLLDPWQLPGKAVLSLGTGSGYLAELLISHRVKEALLISGSRTAALSTTQRIEKKGLSSNSEFTIVAARQFLPAWNQFVFEFLRKNPASVILTHPREVVAFPSLHKRLLMKIQAWRNPFSFQPSAALRKILLAVSSGLLETEIIHELQRGDFKVTTIPALAGKMLTPQQAAELLAHYEPDLVLSVNNLASDLYGLFPQACDDAGVPWATWLLDDPRFILSPYEIDGYPHQRFGFCWDVNGLDSWNRLLGRRAFPLPLATDPGCFFPGEGDHSLKDRLVFVGSPRFASSIGYFAALDQDENAHKIAERMEHSVRLSRKAPSTEDIISALKELNLETPFSLEELRRLPAYIVQMANLKYRKEALIAVAHLHPIVYGEGWRGLLPPSIEVRDSVDYYRELPRIYRSDAVHLSLTNLQMRAYPNQRVFDIGACSQVALGDKLEGFSELFDSSFDDLIFDSLRSLPAQAEWLMNNPSLRRQLGEKLRQVVLDKHTIAHRIDELLKKIIMSE